MAISRGLSTNSTDSDASHSISAYAAKPHGLRALAFLSVLLYTTNGEILQASTSENVPGARCSPMLLMTLCHSFAVVFIPWLALSRDATQLKRVAQILYPDGSFMSALFHVILLSFMLLLPNYLWTKSIAYQPVGTTNAILQTSVGFSYVGSRLFLHGASGVGESFTPAKTCAVLLAIVGSCVGLLPPPATSTSPGSALSHPRASSPVGGVLLALAASAAQGGYQVYSKRTLFGVRERLECMLLVWAGIALVHLLLFLPAVLWLWPLLPAWAGGEPPEFPDPWRAPRAAGGVAFSVCIAGAVNCLNTVVAVRGSPVLLSAAFALSLPLSRCADWAAHREPWTVTQMAGDALILAAFAIMARGQGERGASKREAGEALDRLQSV